MTDEFKSTDKHGSMYVIKLIKGDIPLVVTFWVYGAGINLILKLLSNYVTSNALQIVQHGYGGILNIFPYIYYLYMVLIWVAVWNSARKYKGRLWGTFAQVLVIVGIFAAIASIPLSNQNNELRDNISKMNKSLPYMVAPGIELISTSSDNNGVYFTYRLINESLYNVDVPLVTERLHEALIETGCRDEDTLQMMKLLNNIHYKYLDKNEKIVTEVILTNKDCL